MISVLYKGEPEFYEMHSKNACFRVIAYVIILTKKSHIHISGHHKIRKAGFPVLVNHVPFYETSNGRVDMLNHTFSQSDRMPSGIFLLFAY